MAEIIVSVKQGRLRGKISIDYNGKTFYSFQGIPYAKPPLGKLRFQDPQLADNWEGIKDATKEGNSCYQRNIVTGKVEGSEDCLFLNVYTPQIDGTGDSTLMPVMFWIHGGGFVDGSGSANLYGPEFLVARNVVLVTVNYRLGMLGFLQLQSESLGVPGNAGLKDIILALQWVKSNIQSFLGDPNNITIFGESAGSAAVQYILLSPLSKGLFNKAIMQSGSLFNPWARGYHGVELYSQFFDLKTPDEKEVLRKLQQLSVEELYDLQEKLNDEILEGCRRPVGPCPEAPSSSAFLPKEPKQFLQSGDYNKVPLLIGYTDAEGILSIVLGARHNRDPVHNDFEKLIPHHFNLTRGNEESKQVAAKIREFYYGDKEPSLDILDAYVKLESDFNIIHDVRNFLKNVVQHSHHPVYLYRFCVEGELNFLKNMSRFQVKGAAHADELGYLFKRLEQPEIIRGSLEDKTVRRITKLWANFAKYGNPTPTSDDELLNVEWKPVTVANMHYLNIDQDLTVGDTDDPEAERMKFWNSLYENYPSAKYW